MDIDLATELVKALPQAAICVLSGFIGTYFGAKVMRKSIDRGTEAMRDVAIRGLKAIKKYKTKSYKEAESEFNNTLSIVEKRSVIVALHKVGLPFVFPIEESEFLAKIRFEDKTINLDDINGMITQIKNGYCDKYFHKDEAEYFSDKLQKKAKRDILIKFIENVLPLSIRKTKSTFFPKHWAEKNNLGIGEFILCDAFIRAINMQGFFDDEGKPKIKLIKKLKEEVSIGLYDSMLNQSLIDLRRATSLDKLTNLQIKKILQDNEEENAEDVD